MGRLLSEVEFRLSMLCLLILVSYLLRQASYWRIINPLVTEIERSLNLIAWLLGRFLFCRRIELSHHFVSAIRKLAANSLIRTTYGIHKFPFDTLPSLWTYEMFIFYESSLLAVILAVLIRCRSRALKNRDFTRNPIEIVWGYLSKLIVFYC